MAENYLAEAFKSFNILKEDAFDVSPEGLDKLDSFFDGDTVDSIDIIDTNAETSDELEDSYVGKVILKCPVCTSLVYEDAEDILVDEDTDMVNIDEECPYCHTQGGFNIVGQVAEYCKDCINKDQSVDEGFDFTKNPNTIAAVLNDNMDKLAQYTSAEELKQAIIDLLDKSDIADKPSVEKCKQILTAKKSIPALLSTIGTYITGIKTNPKTLKENFDKDAFEEIKKNVTLFFQKKGFCVDKEGVQNYIDGVAEYLLMYKEDGEDYPLPQWYKDTELNYPEDIEFLKEVSGLNESFKEVNITTDTEKMSMSSDDTGKTVVITEPISQESTSAEVIEPVDAETTNIIADAQDDETIDVDIEDFDEDSFDEVNEKYLKTVYENVNKYKTTAGTVKGNTLILEGLITFKSGKQATTKYLFEGKDITKTGKARFVGCNKDLCKGNKPFTLRGKVEKDKFITESFAYNYKGICAKSGKTEHCYGTINRK